MTGRLTKLSSDFTDKLASMVSGYVPPESFERFIEITETEIRRHYFTHTSESNLLRIISGMYDKVSFFLDAVKYPHYIEIAAAAAANSNYLTDILVMNPEFFYRIVNPSVLNKKLEYDSFNEEVSKSLASFKSFNARLNALRSIKRREILKTGLKDILSVYGLKDVTEELSILASVLSAALFNECYKEVILKKYNGTDPFEGCSYTIAALGKLGGGELNYSSDIDLIIFYDDNGNSGYNMFLTEAVYLFIESASAVTSKGYLYRVDFRLRPDGRTAPLCRSLNEYLNYYESRGEDWERQMLIKAGFVAGSRILYDRFINYLQPFIYPSTFMVSPLKQITRLKKNIEKGLRDDKNIKLVPGGIRDIEFSVQALQLINGGRFTDLKTGNTLTAIEKLNGQGLISADEKETLTEAYTLYRRIEHYLQLMNDTQTHDIPEEGELLEKISSYLGHKSVHEFKRYLRDTRSRVQGIYMSIMGINGGGNETGIDIMQSIKFENAARAGKDLLFLREGKGLLGQKEFDKTTIFSFQKIEPALADFLSVCPNPDTVLQNFVRIMRPVKLPSIWYNEFKDTQFFRSFLTLCSLSQKSVELFAEDDALREFFISRRVFAPEDIRLLTVKQLIFTLAARFTLGLITRSEVSASITEYAAAAAGRAAEELFPDEYGGKYFIAALGSFGSGELLPASDIDLIFVMEDIRDDEVQKRFQEYLLLLKERLKPFEIDCRLRPEGKSSLLVWDISTYTEYLKKRGRIWEFQAYSKLRYIYGSSELFSRFADAAAAQAAASDKSKLVKEISEMRKKTAAAVPAITRQFNLKKSRGGITDIEFVLQYLLLSDEAAFRRNMGKTTAEVITGLSSEHEGLSGYTRNYEFLKRIELTIQNLFSSAAALLPAAGGREQLLAHASGFRSAAEMNAELQKVIKENLSLYDKYLKQT